MICRLKALDQFFGRMAEVLTGGAVVVQTIVVFAQVCFRYLLKSPLVWAEELARYLLVFISFFGGYVALRAGALAKVDVLKEKLPGKPAKVLGVLADVLAFLLLIAVAYYGTKLALSPTIVKQWSPAMGLPMYWAYGIIPVAAVIMAFHLVVRRLG